LEAPATPLGELPLLSAETRAKEPHLSRAQRLKIGLEVTEASPLRNRDLRKAEQAAGAQRTAR